MSSEHQRMFMVSEDEMLRLEKALNDAQRNLNPEASPTARNEVVEGLRLVEEIRGRTS